MSRVDRAPEDDFAIQRHMYGYLANLDSLAEVCDVHVLDPRSIANRVPKGRASLHQYIARE